MGDVRPVLKFRVHQGGTSREVELTSPVIKIGKAAGSHLRVDSESVGRMHAVIEVTSADDISLIDLGSATGTYVNDQKINKAKIQAGDVLRLGDVRIDFAIAMPVEAPVPVVIAAPPPPPPPPPRVAVAAPVAIDEPGPRAVEVAAMLGDSVVQVKHCMNPRSTGKVTRLTYGVFAASALLMIVGLAAFAMGVQNASHNTEKLEHWTKPVADGGLGKPDWSFRPTMLSASPAVFDAITFGGMIGGLFLLAWGVARTQSERRSPWFRVGQDEHVEYTSSDAPAGAFALIAPRDGDFVLNLAPGMEGELTVEGRPTPIPVGQETRIPQHARIRVKSGKTTFLVSSVAQPKAYPVPLFAGVEANVVGYFAGSAIVFLGLWALLRAAHGGVDTASGEDDNRETAELIGSTDSTEEPPPEVADEIEANDDEAGSNPGMTAALDEGASGKQDAANTGKRTAIKDNGLPPSVARQQALAAAKVAGILGSESFASASFSTITGTSDMSSGFDGLDAMGTLTGDEPGDSYGFGQGVHGFGPGGGGRGWGTYGAGDFGTIGGGDGAGDGFQPGGGHGKGRKHKPAVPVLRIGQPQGGGDLDKSTIRRYIKRNLAKIKYCYEKELLASPGLSGTVDTQFLINPNGSVGQVSAKGVNSDVSSCVAGVLKAIQFPKPNGGGPVNVTSYPFEFHPSGG